MESNFITNSLQMLFQLEISKESNLRCITASLDPNGERDPSARSQFHWQIFKCRMLLFTAPVLASPVWGTERDILVVASKEDHEKGRLDAHLKRLGLLRTSPDPSGRHVTNGDYSSCLLYTMRAHMAPQWNFLDDFMVEGRDFLSVDVPRNVIKLEINVQGEEGCAWLSLQACRVHLPHLELADLVSAPHLNEFFNSPDYKLDGRVSENPWVHVYPSFKRGVVMSISRQIPENCLYSNYTDLSRHWKNMYGYRLPAESDNMLYCEVYFKPRGSTYFTYPMCCLSSHRPVPLRARDPLAIAKSFLDVLVHKMPEVCGHPVRVHSDRVNLPVRELRPAGEELELPNLLEESLVPNSCPLSVATQPGISKPHFMWYPTPAHRSAGTGPIGFAGKENSPPEVRESSKTEIRDSNAGFNGSSKLQTGVQLDPTPINRPLLRPIFKASVRATSGPPKAKTVPDNKPKLKPIFNPRTNCSGSLQPRPLESSSALASDSLLDPVLSDKPALVITPYKPIFLSIKPKGPAERLIASTVSSKKKLNQAGTVAFESTLSTPPPIARRITECDRPDRSNREEFVGSPPTARKSVKRPAEDLPLPNFTSAEQVRRTNAQTLIAWLRAHGVSCRVKDKKAELVEKVLSTVKL